MTRAAYIPELSVVIIFEADEAAVTQGAVWPGAVVPGHVLHDRPAGRWPGGPRLRIDQLALSEAENSRPRRCPLHWPLRPHVRLDTPNRFTGAPPAVLLMQPGQFSCPRYGADKCGGAADHSGGAA